MTPSQKLTERLDALLLEHGLRVDPHDGIVYPKGANRREDCCRWSATAQKIDKPTITITMASWDTVTACAKAPKLVASFDQPRTEARIMISVA